MYMNIDKVMPFSLWSSLYIFNLLADAVSWILLEHYDMKYLEDYLDDDVLGVCPPSITVHLFGRRESIPLGMEHGNF